MKNRICNDCGTIESPAWYKKGTQCKKCYLNVYYKKNKIKWANLHKTEKKKEYMKKWWKNNKNKKQEYSKTYYEKHFETIRKKQNEYKFEYVRRPDVKRRMNFATIKRQERTKKATPAWIDLSQIKLIYEKCPEGYEVDHIVPLQNDLVCGLHVPWNFQYLTRFENRSKNNKFKLDGGDSE